MLYDQPRCDERCVLRCPDKTFNCHLLQNAAIKQASFLFAGFYIRFSIAKIGSSTFCELATPELFAED
jgi:hypothetical protein